MGLTQPRDRKMKAAFLILVSATLAGCSTIAGETKERRVVYACNYGPELTITYAPGTARVESAEGTVSLRQRTVASGFWYESATHSLRGSGDDITYVNRQMAPKKCQKRAT